MLGNEKLLELRHSLIVLRVDFVGVCVEAQEQCVLSIPSCCYLSNTHPNHACHAHMAHGTWHRTDGTWQALQFKHVTYFLCSLPPPTRVHAHEEKEEGWRGRVKERMRGKGRRTWRGRGGGSEKEGEEEGESETSLRALTMGMEASPLVSPWKDATTYLCPEFPTHVNAAKSPVLILVINLHCTTCHTYQCVTSHIPMNHVTHVIRLDSITFICV